jgi:tetratricopeptide (TPR) repeat protein
MFDHEEVGFVVCASCGTRIKANRERCLRCEAPLVAWQKPELLPSWLQRLGGGTLVFGVVTVAVLLFVVVTFVDSRSRTPGDSARPVNAADAARAARPLVTPTPASAIEPVAYIDTPQRGTVDLMRADFSALRVRYEEQLSKRPSDPELLNNLGLTLERLGRVDEAIARFENALQFDPLNFSYHFNLAHAASQRRDWDRSIAEYRLAASRMPGDYATRYNLAMAIYLKGDQVSSIPEFQKGIEMAPGVAAFHLALGVCYDKLGRMIEAAREYEAYIAMAPSAPDADLVRSHLKAMPGSPRS